MEELKTKSFLSFLVNIIIFLLVSAGALLVAWRFIAGDVILFFTQVPIVTEDFELNLIEMEETAEFDWDVVEQLDATYWLDYINISDDEVHPIGELLIPSIDARLPIFHGVGEPNITIGVGTMKPEFVMGEGNITLASHWDPNPGVRFGGLHLIEYGDLLILRDSNYLYIYETIIYNTIIEGYRSDIVEDVEGKIYLTLFTCTPDGSRRVMVRGEFASQVLIADLEAAADSATEDSAVELEELVDLGRLDVEIIIDVIETIEETEVPFPTMEVALAVGGSLLLGLLVVRISNRGYRRR